MKKFIFRLETLLKVRKAREGALKRDLEHLIHKSCCADEKKKMISGQITALIEEMHKRRKEGNLELQETYTKILEHLNSSLAQISNSISNVEKQVEEQKERLRQAILERKVIEKIKEKHYAGWRTRDAQSEGSLLDECAHEKNVEIK